MENRLRLMVMEEHPVVSAGLRRILDAQTDMTVISEVRSSDDAVSRLRLQRHDVILMDVGLRGCETLKSFQKILQAADGAKLLVFSAQQGDGDILRALNAGASGYMLKSASREEIVATVRKVAKTGRYLAPEIAQRVAEYIGKEVLTEREIQVLALVREGWRNRQIAGTLRVAETTVNFHIKNTLAKLAANDRTHAVTIATKRGLL